MAVPKVLLAVQVMRPESELSTPARERRETGEAPDQVREVENLVGEY